MTVADQKAVEQTLMRELEQDEKGYVDALLERAEAMILMRIPDAVNRSKVDFQYRVVLTMVESEAVARVLRAPGGGLYKYETEGTYTYSVNTAVASGLLEITQRDWQALSGGTSGWGGATAVMDGYAQRMGRSQWSPDVSREFLMSFKRAAFPNPPAAPELGVPRWEGWKLP